jgi:hypothetical protein
MFKVVQLKTELLFAVIFPLIVAVGIVELLFAVIFPLIVAVKVPPKLPFKTTFPVIVRVDVPFCVVVKAFFACYNIASNITIPSTILGLN